MIGRLTKTWQGRLLIVLLSPVWIPLAVCYCILFFLSFVVWNMIGPPIMWIIKGVWIEPTTDDWMKKGDL